MIKKITNISKNQLVIYGPTEAIITPHVISLIIGKWLGWWCIFEIFWKRIKAHYQTDINDTAWIFYNKTRLDTWFCFILTNIVLICVCHFLLARLVKYTKAVLISERRDQNKTLSLITKFIKYT